MHRQQGAAAATATGLTLSVSFDNGATWTAVPTTNRGGGRFEATIHNPAPGQYVSLRVQASDSGGSGITQTIIRAYQAS